MYESINIDIDFNKMNQQWVHQRIGKQYGLCKAVGLGSIKNTNTLTILDATAGLGKDSFILAKMGCQVTLCERHDLLAHQLKRALDQFTHTDIKQRMQFIATDALDYLVTCPLFDVIYLDPMFPEKTKNALVKKNMQQLQQLVGTDSDSDQLLDLAKQKANKRVVVKRHKTAPNLAEQTPNYSIKGKSIRYDIY